MAEPESFDGHSIPEQRDRFSGAPESQVRRVPGLIPQPVAANPAAQDLGIRANDLVKQLATAVDGRGGGKADLAQGSGKNPTGIDAALDAVRSEIAVIARVG